MRLRSDELWGWAMPELPRQDGPGCPVRWSGRQAVVVLPEQVGLSNAGPVARQLLAVLDRGAAVLIADMTATRSCDYAGVDALARVYQRAVAHDTELRLVTPAPVVRRIVALSGLDRLVSVFPALEAAQAAQHPPAVVLPLRPKAASNRSAALAPPDGPYPVTRVPVTSSGGLDGFGHAAQQDIRRHEPEDTLTRITDGIFHAGLTLQAALDQPGDGLRQAAERTLDLLDETVRQAREAAFARHRHAPHGLDGTADPAAAGGGPARAARGEAEALRARSGSIRTRSRELRARTLEVAISSAAAQDRVAATLGHLASSHPRYSAALRELSQAAASRATRLRQWADDHAAGG
jgi:anti-anti-sigma factor